MLKSFSLQKSITVCLKSIFFSIIDYHDAIIAIELCREALSAGGGRSLTDRKTGGGDAVS